MVDLQLCQSHHLLDVLISQIHLALDFKLPVVWWKLKQMQLLGGIIKIIQIIWIVDNQNLNIGGFGHYGQV